MMLARPPFPPRLPRLPRLACLPCLGRLPRAATFAVAAATLVAGCAAELPVFRARASSPQNAIGVTLLLHGNESAAEAAFDRALSDALRTNDPDAEIDARLNLALMATDRRENDRAVHHLVLAVDRMLTWPNLDTEDRSVSFLTAAELIFAVGQREMSELLHARALSLGEDAGHLLALAACARGGARGEQSDHAIRRFETAARDAVHLRILRCEAHAAMQRGNTDLALAYADRAIEVDKRGHDTRALRDDLALGARALEQGERKEKALYRWLEVARVDAAMAHQAGLEEVAAVLATIASSVSPMDRARAAAVMGDLRDRLALQGQRGMKK